MTDWLDEGNRLGQAAARDSPNTPDPAPGEIGDPDTERALISAALRDQNAASTVAAMPLEAWTDRATRRLAEIIRWLDHDGHPVDEHVVANRLTSAPDLDTVGGLPGVLKIAAVDGRPDAAGHYSLLILEQHQLRTIRTAATAAAAAAESRNLEQAITALSHAVDNLPDVDEAGDIAGLIPRYMDVLLARERGDTRALPTGMHDLDGIIGGLHPGNLVIVGARTGMGKTAVLGQLALNAAAAGARPLFVSLEMPWPELLDRWVGNWAHVNTRNLRRGDISGKWEAVTDALDRITKLGIRVAKPSTVTVPAIRAEARRHSADVVIVDYLQLVHATSGRRNANRENDVAEVSRALKGLGLALDLPVVAAAQLNRNLEGRLNKRPELSDLRDSGQIEQDADVVVMVYREGAYEQDADQGALELIVRKNRHGELDTAHMVFNGGFQQVLSRAPEYRLRSV